VAVAFDAASAVTVTLNGVAGATLAGAVTLKCVAGGGATVVFVLPVIPPSVAVIDCAPFVVNVTLKVCEPLSPATKV
jgi:hypothetical protein